MHAVWRSVKCKVATCSVCNFSFLWRCAVEHCELLQCLYMCRPSCLQYYQQQCSVFCLVQYFTFQVNSVQNVFQADSIHFMVLRQFWLCSIVDSKQGHVGHSLCTQHSDHHSFMAHCEEQYRWGLEKPAAYCRKRL